MTSTFETPRPPWLKAHHEAPAMSVPADIPGWSEHYLTYAYAPGPGMGLWTHLTRRPGPPEVWDELVALVLPGDRLLVAKGSSRGTVTADGVQVNGMAFRCDEPFVQWTKTFRGGMRPVTTEALRRAPLTDGPNVPVDLELTFRGMSPVFDLGSSDLDQDWGHGHYEQHCTVTGSITIDDRTSAFDGTGLQEHSWGARDYSLLGETFWAQAQFPESGRTFMAIRVSGRPPRPDFSYVVVGDRRRVQQAATAVPLPLPTRDEDMEQDVTLRLTLPDGSTAVISTELFGPVPMTMVGPVEMAFGRHPDANRLEREVFARFTWDGEVGYGLVDRTLDLTEHA